ncbi:hypothetical protein C8R44DRAFT_764907 [Mycena epipterygia]|nr:hypothetical protein C8R44DRAFT_764907 [Mycena epipterygia]
MPRVRSVPSRVSQRSSTDDVGSECESWPGELLYPDSDAETVVSKSRSASPVVKSSPPPPTRTSHARQRPEHHIPRPPNPFILFRTDYCVLNKQAPGGVRDHRMVSRLAGQAWNQLDMVSREKYVVRAEERKRLHAIQYPDYSYAPSSRSKGKKRKAEDDCDYEERVPQSKPRRRSPRGSAQSLGVGVVVDAESPSPTDSTRKRARLAPTTRSASPSPELDRSQTPELSPNTSSESPDPEPILHTPTTSLQLVHDVDDFVPTADIPPLDLYADAPDKKKVIEIDHSLRPSLSYDVGSQFFKAEIPKQARDVCMWYNTDGTYNASNETSSDSWPNDAADLLPINYSAVQFTNPFAGWPGPALELEIEELIHADHLH